MTLIKKLTKGIIILIILLFDGYLSTSQGKRENIALRKVEIHQFRNKLFRVYKVALPSSNISFHLKNERQQPLATFERLRADFSKQDRTLLFAMNGGIYHKNLNPVGLYIEKGKTLKDINLRNDQGNFYLKPNGVFYIKEDNTGGIMESKSFQSQIAKSTPIKYALQSGPQLVINNNIHPKFNDGSPNELSRNGVGMINETEFVFVISLDDVNLFTFASFFRDYLGCANALYLDGFISGMYWDEAGQKRQVRYAERPFSVMIADTEPAKSVEKPNTDQETKQTPATKPISQDNTAQDQIQQDEQPKETIAKPKSNNVFEVSNQYYTIAQFSQEDFILKAINSKMFYEKSELFWTAKTKYQQEDIQEKDIMAMYTVSNVVASKANNKWLKPDGSEYQIKTDTSQAGVICINQKGLVKLLSVEDMKTSNVDEYPNAIIAGDFLIKDGQPTEAYFNSQEARILSAIATDKTGNVILISTDKYRTESDDHPDYYIKLKDFIGYLQKFNVQQAVLISSDNRTTHSVLQQKKPNWNVKINPEKSAFILSVIKRFDHEN